MAIDGQDAMETDDPQIEPVNMEEYDEQVQVPAEVIFLKYGLQIWKHLCMVNVDPGPLHSW